VPARSGNGDPQSFIVPTMTQVEFGKVRVRRIEDDGNPVTKLHTGDTDFVGSISKAHALKVVKG